jgi:hypothetical protein
MIEMLVNLPSPIPELQHTPLLSKCYEPGNMPSTSYYFVVFILDSHLGLLRRLGMCQIDVGNSCKLEQWFK